MGTITIGLSGSGIVNGSKTYTIADAGVTKLIAAVRARKPVTPDTRTDAQVLAVWADSIIQAERDALTKIDRDAAVAAAASATPAVVIT